MTMPDSDAARHLATAASALRTARRVVVVTSARLSGVSGVWLPELEAAL
jgi:hypothetical protein